MNCPPCHGECDKGKPCPAEFHPGYESWSEYYKSLKIDIQASRFMYARSSYGRAYRAGYDAGFKAAKKSISDDWKLLDNDQA